MNNAQKIKKSDSVPPTCPRCHIRNTQKTGFFLHLNVRIQKCNILAGKKKKSLGCRGFKGNSKPAKSGKKGKKPLENKSLSSPLIHGRSAVFTANSVSSSCWRGGKSSSALRRLKERDVSICFLGIFHGEDPLTPQIQARSCCLTFRCPNWEGTNPQPTPHTQTEGLERKNSLFF